VEVFQTIPSVTSSSAGASLPVDARDGHVYSEQRRLAYRLFQLRAELATLEDQFARTSSPRTGASSSGTPSGSAVASGPDEEDLARSARDV